MYAEKKGWLQVIGTVTVADLAVAAVNHRFLCVGIKQIIRRVAVVVQTAVVSASPLVITPRKRPTPGSSSGQSSGSTITIPGGTAAGTVIYKDLATPITLLPGEELAFEVTTAAGTSGAGWCFVEEVEESPEMAANMSNHTASV